MRLIASSKTIQSILVNPIRVAAFVKISGSGFFFLVCEPVTITSKVAGGDADLDQITLHFDVIGTGGHSEFEPVSTASRDKINDTKAVRAICPESTPGESHKF